MQNYHYEHNSNYLYTVYTYEKSNTRTQEQCQRVMDS